MKEELKDDEDTVLCSQLACVSKLIAPIASSKNQDMDGDDADGGLSLRDIRYHMETEIAKPMRNLEVRGFTVVWEKETMYGNRLGQHAGLLVTANHPDGGNVFHASDLWKNTVVHAKMLPRADMIKASEGLNTGQNLTDVQEHKQALLGCLVVPKMFTNGRTF